MKDYCVLYFCDEGLHVETCFSMASLAKFASESLEIVFLQQGYSKALPQTLIDYIVSAVAIELSWRSLMLLRFEV